MHRQSATRQVRALGQQQRKGTAGVEQQRACRAGDSTRHDGLGQQCWYARYLLAALVLLLRAAAALRSAGESTPLCPHRPPASEQRPPKRRKEHTIVPPQTTSV
jgi:hypothetical protein